MKHLGIHVSRSSVRLVLVRGNRVTLQRELAIANPEGLAGALATSLRHAGGWRGCRATVALGPALSQSKRLEGIPRVRRLTDLRDVVREGVDRFFIGDADCLVLVRRVGDAVIADRFDASLIAQIADVARQVNAGRITVVSAASALAAATGEGRAVIAEDGIVLHVVSERGRPQHVQRRPAHAEDVPPPQVRMPGGFELAIGASRAAANGNSAHRIRIRTPSWNKMRKCAVALLLTGIAAGGAFGPIAMWHGQARRTSAELLSLSSAYRGAAGTERELAETKDLLRSAQRWLRREPNLVVGFAALTRTLPAGTAVAALAVDSAGGSFTVIAARVADVLTAVDSSTAFSDVRLAGSVMADHTLGASLTRASLRFAFERRP